MSETPEKKINHNELPQNPEEELGIEEQIERAENEGLRIAQIDAALGKENVEKAGGTDSEIGQAKRAGEELVNRAKGISRRIPGSDKPNMAVILHKEDITPEQEKELGIEIPQYEALALTPEQKKRFYEIRGSQESAEGPRGEEGLPEKKRVQNAPTPEPKTSSKEAKINNPTKTATPEEELGDKEKTDQKSTEDAARAKAEQEAWLNLTTDERLENSAQNFRSRFGKKHGAAWKEYWSSLTPEERKNYSVEKKAAEEKIKWLNLAPEERERVSAENFKNTLGKKHDEEWEKYWSRLTPKERLIYSSERFKNTHRVNGETFGEEQEALKPQRSTFDRYADRIYEKGVIPVIYFIKRGWKRSFGMETRGSARNKMEEYRNMGEDAEFMGIESYANESLYRKARWGNYWKHYTDDATRRKYHFELVGDYKRDGKFSRTARLYKIYE